MPAPVDSFRFLSFATRRVVRAWIEREPPVVVSEIPWTPLGRRLEETTVALVSTAALAAAGDLPFDQDGERQNPWWGDPSIRVIPRETAAEDLRVYHLHVDPRPAELDPDCVFPLRRLSELEQEGAIARSAPSHYSFMGYQLDPEKLLDNSDEMVTRMHREEVQLALLAPY